MGRHEEVRAVGRLLGAAFVALSVWSCGDEGADDTAPPLTSWCHAVADGTACDDGNPCTTRDVCGQGVCLGRPITEALSCDDGDPCTEADQCGAGECKGAALDCAANPAACVAAQCTAPPVCDCPAVTTACRVAVCDSLTGACSEEPAEDGAACDDHEACTTNDVCAAGVCGGEAVVCAGDDACHSAYCDPLDGACRVQQLPNGTVCDDGNPCSLGETCSFGDCGGSTPAPDGTTCDDPDPCTAAGACMAGWCDAPPVDCSALDLGCLIGVCDASLGGCVTSPGPDGGLCEDGDPCTLIESCKAGACTGGTNVCQCKGKADGSPCDDGDACTSGDACAAELCAGAARDCSSLDGQCTLGSCDVATGDCVATSLVAGTPCDDGAACTVADVCLTGVCAGTPADCSAVDTNCAYGTCDAGTGVCVASPRADGTPCSDGDACSGADACAAGACHGSKDLCGACTGKAAGDTCDDGDLCTSSATCVEKGALMVCVGEPAVCPEPPMCKVAVCNPATGSCSTVAGPNGAACDDGNSCTIGDGCSGGTCAGTAIGLCGATVAACEGSSPNDLPAQAWPITLKPTSEWAASWSGMARIDTEGESDWLSVAAKGGQHISVTTRAHCQSSLDTLVTVYRVTGVTGASLVLEELAYADGGGVGLWAATGDVQVPQDGTYLLQISAWPSAGTGSYLVDVTVAWPAPCKTSADCSCAQMACLPDGTCAPGMPDEEEPNGTLEATLPKAIPVSWRGTFFAPDDADWYALSLEAGVPVDLSTSEYCGEGADPMITLHDANGKVLASNSDGGGEGQALLNDFMAPATGVYYALVTDEAVSGGSYVFSAKVGGCLVTADCACGDQSCAAQTNTSLPKLCVPKVESPESAGAPWSMKVGDRVHAHLQDASDTDEFSVQVGAGVWQIGTETYCGSSVDTLLGVYGPDGAALADDDDSGDGFFARVVTLDVSEPITLRIEVGLSSGEGGDFILSVVPAAAP